MTQSILITGANRGIGLGFVKYYVEAGWQVHAAARSESSELTAIMEAHDNLQFHQLDVTDHAQVEALGNELAAASLDVIVHNAGVYGENQNFGEIDYNSWRRVIEVNTLSPIKCAETWVGAVRPNGSMVFISSLVGSIEEASSDGFIYSTSKAALNMAVKRLSVVLKDRKVKVLAFHPGSVMTDMNEAGKINVKESVTGMTKVIENLSASDSGSFKNWQGKAVAW